MTKYELSKACKVLKAVSDKLADVLNNLKWSRLWDDYLKENEVEERNHDKLRPESISRPITIMDAARLFAVQQVVEYVQGKPAPDPASYLFMRKTIFTAYGLYSEYKAEIIGALKDVDLQYIMNLDYAEMMSEQVKPGSFEAVIA